MLGRGFGLGREEERERECRQVGLVGRVAVGGAREKPQRQGGMEGGGGSEKCQEVELTGKNARLDFGLGWGVIKADTLGSWVVGGGLSVTGVGTQDRGTSGMCAWQF